MRRARLLVLITAGFLSSPLCAAEPAGALKFAPSQNEFRFDTGTLRGTFRAGGRSLGLMPVVDTTTGNTISGAYGLLSHYRMFDAQTRFGSGAWDWSGKGVLHEDGSASTLWSADGDHPFDMRADYRWLSPGTIDVTTTVVPKRNLRRFEIFLASYWSGFPESRVYVEKLPETGKPGFMAAVQSAGTWQMFPRDEAAIEMYRDGRWKRPPNPVDWTVMPHLAAPLAMRRDSKSGLVCLVMARPEDCFAVATPFGEEGHRSIYLSLFGRDLDASQGATARVRLLVRKNLTDEQAVVAYKEFLAAR